MVEESLKGRVEKALIEVGEEISLDMEGRRPS